MNNLEEQEIITADNQYWASMKDSIEVLRKCPHFKRVILDGYFKNSAIDGVSMLGNRAVIAENRRSEIMEGLIAISNLEHFLLMAENLGTPDISEDEEE